MKASSASESGPYATNQRPFFYAQPTAQQPFPNPWFLGPVYNPYGIPAAGLRSGNPYFPFYSVPVQEYSGYLVPQHPVQMRVNRRPYFNSHPPPMFYQATRFRHYSPGKRTETKETQTDPKQPESKQKKHQDHSIETKGCDAGNEACALSGNGLGIESPMENPEMAVSPATSDRDFAKSSSSSVQFRTLPPPGYAFEKEEVRIEYGNGGTPAIQLWKSFKETIPLYDVAKKPVTENVMQRDMFALSSCEGVVYGPREQVELMPSISYSEEQRAVDTVQEKESQHKTKLDSEKGVADHRAKSPLDEARAVQLAEPTRSDQLGPRQDGAMLKRFSGLKRSSGSKGQDISSLARQRELFPSSMEITNDLYCPQKLNEHDIARENYPASDKSLWCDESEKYLPTESWLACLDNVDANYNYSMYLSQRKRPSVLSITSDEKSSADEDSSTDNVSVSYYVSDYLPQNKYTLKRNTNGLEREKIKSGGSLNEDEEVVRAEQATATHRRNSKKWSSVKIKELSSRSRKLGVLPRSSSSKQLYALKKKAIKSLSPSEADDSEEYWVEEEDDEEEEEEEEEEEAYLNQEGQRRTLTPSKSGLYRQGGQKVLWRVPKNVPPAHLISWPIQDKTKMPGLAAKVKEPDQDEDLCDEYTYWLKRSAAAHVLEQRRNSQKYSGRITKDGGRIAADEYWIKSGARPKFASLVYGGLSPTSKTSERDALLAGMSRKKGIRKPPHKRRDTRHDSDEVEEWEKRKPLQRKGRITKRSLYKRR